MFTAKIFSSLKVFTGYIQGLEQESSVRHYPNEG